MFLPKRHLCVHLKPGQYEGRLLFESQSVAKKIKIKYLKMLEN